MARTALMASSPMRPPRSQSCRPGSRAPRGSPGVRLECFTLRWEARSPRWSSCSSHQTTCVSLAVAHRTEEDLMLERLTDFCYRHRRLVVAGWLVVLVATVVAGSRFGGGDTTDYGTPGSESKAATNLLDERFPARSGDTIDIVWRAEDVTTAAVRQPGRRRPGRGGRLGPRRRRRQPVPRRWTGPDRSGRHRRLRHGAARHLGHARRGHPATARHRRRRQ